MALFFAATIDIFQQVHVAGTTLGGIITVAAAGLLVLLAIPLLGQTRRYVAAKPDREPLLAAPRRGVPVALWAFLAWALLVTLVYGTGTQGVQNLAVYTMFILGMGITSAQSSAGTALTYTTRLGNLGVVVTVIYLATVLVSGIGSNLIYGPRSYALTALVFLAVTIPIPRHVERKWIQWAPYLILLAIGLSLSRTAGLAALIIITGRSVRGRRGGRLVRAFLLAVAAAWCAWWLIQHNATLHERVFGGDAAYRVNGLTINTEGRALAWRVVNQQIATHEWTGHGPGASTDFVREQIQTIPQPHNDYLRLWDDFGRIGLGLWLLGMASILVRCYRRARSTRDPLQAMPHYAAILGLVGVSIAMATDNAIIYPFVMMPLGVLIGASLGSRGAEAGPDEAVAAT